MSPEGFNGLSEWQFREEKLKRVKRFGEKILANEIQEPSDEELVEVFFEYWNKKRKKEAKEKNKEFIPVRIENIAIDELRIDLEASIQEARRGELKFKNTNDRLMIRRYGNETNHGK